MINRSTEALDPQNTVFDMEIRGPCVSKKQKNKIHVIAWDPTKTYTFAVFSACFIVWALVFFPILILTDM